jgi:hypothetical protein
LVVAHLEEAAGGGEQEAESVLGDGVVVETDASGNCDLRGVKSSVQNVIRAGCEGLNPFYVLQALSGVLEVIGRVGPGDEDVGINVLFGDRRLDIIRVQ